MIRPQGNDFPFIRVRRYAWKTPLNDCAGLHIDKTRQVLMSRFRAVRANVRGVTGKGQANGLAIRS